MTSQLHVSLSALFKICVTIKPRTVIAEEGTPLLRGYAPGFHGTRNPGFHVAHKFFRTILHIVKHLGNGFAIDNLVDFIMVLIARDVYGVRVTEKIMEVAKNLLVCPYKE